MEKGQVMLIEPASTIGHDGAKAVSKFTWWVEIGFSATLKSERQIWVLVQTTYLKKSAGAQD